MLDFRQVFWSQGILENKKFGFANWSDDDLRRELSGRGFESGNPLDAAGECDSDERKSEGHEFLRLAGHLGSMVELHYLND